MLGLVNIEKERGEERARKSKGIVVEEAKRSKSEGGWG